MLGQVSDRISGDIPLFPAPINPWQLNSRLVKSRWRARSLPSVPCRNIWPCRCRGGAAELPPPRPGGRQRPRRGRPRPAAGPLARLRASVGWAMVALEKRSRALAGSTRRRARPARCVRPARCAGRGGHGGRGSVAAGQTRERREQDEEREDRARSMTHAQNATRLRPASPRRRTGRGGAPAAQPRSAA